MKNLSDNMMFQILARIGDLMVVNLLFVICCLPVVTIGASLSAMTRFVQDIVLESEGGVWKSFFRAFRQNFKQSTILWLAEAVVLFALIFYRGVIHTYCTGILGTVLGVILFLVAVMLLGIAVYVHPLLVRYNNTLKEHLRNGAILAVIKLPKTLLLAALAALPLIILKLSVTVFIQSTFFFLVGGFAAISYFSCVLLKPVFRELEGDREQNSDVTLFK